MEKQIKYKNGYKIVLINIEDENIFKERLWHINFKSGKFYVKSDLPKKKCTYLHREILKVKDLNLLVDHINGNPLDNRKENLRISNKSTNGMNRGKNKNNNSGYKGVSFDKRQNSWAAEIMVNGKRFRKFGFKSVKEAALKYNELAILHHGEFAVLNEVK